MGRAVAPLGSQPPGSGLVGALADLDERVLRAQRAGDDGDSGLVADRLYDQDGVRVLELDARGVAAGFEGAPDVVAERALDGGRVETALESAALEADEEGPAGEAIDERLGGGGERLDGGRRLEAHRRLDRDHPGERGGEERIGVERLAPARAELVHALDRADHHVAVAAAPELPQAPECDQEGVPPALERGGEDVPGRHRRLPSFLTPAEARRAAFGQRPRAFARVLAAQEDALRE